MRAIMMAALDALLAQPMVLLVILAVGAGIGIAIEKLFNGIERDRQRAYWAGRKAGQPKNVRHLKPVREPEVRSADFRGEATRHGLRRQLHFARAAQQVGGQGVRGARQGGDRAQSRLAGDGAGQSLGEFLGSPDKNAFLAVNSKRVDFALMNENCRVVHALEYQGSGHHTGASAAARDAVKKEALRKAGIGYHEVVAGHTTPSELRALVERLVPPLQGALR